MPSRQRTLLDEALMPPLLPAEEEDVTEREALKEGRPYPIRGLGGRVPLLTGVSPPSRQTKHRYPTSPRLPPEMEDEGVLSTSGGLGAELQRKASRRRDPPVSVACFS